MTKTKTKPEASTVAERIIQGLEKLDAAFAKGGMEEVEKQFRVTRVKKPPITPKDVIRIRKKQLGATQELFASLLGVPVGTVRAWERGTEELSAMAEKFLNEMRYNGDYWKKRVQAVTAKRGR